MIKLPCCPANQNRQAQMAITKKIIERIILSMLYYFFAAVGVQLAISNLKHFSIPNAPALSPDKRES
jgi:hypothetical protein